MADVTDSDIYEAIEAVRGNVAAAAKSLGMKRHVLKERIDRTPTLVALLDDVREGIVDQAEQNRFADVEKGDPGASNFILQTLGKSRGYSMGVAGMGKDGAIVVEIKKFSEGKSDGEVQ